MKGQFRYRKLTSVEQQLLAAIRLSGAEWQTREEIAQHLGKKKLDAYHLSRLKKLQRWSLIDARRTKQPGARLIFEYRSVDTQH